MERIKRSFSKLFLSLLFSCLFFSLGGGQVLAGFGISPPRLANDFLLPGSHYEQVIYLVRGEPKETLFTRIEINAPEIESWIRVESGMEFELPAGVQQFPVKFIVDVPQNAELKLYEGTIDILTSPEKAKDRQVTVALGAQAEIALRVTEQELSAFEFRGITLEDAEKGSPIKLVLKIENKRNQETGPTRAYLKIFDQYHSVLLEESEADIFEKVEPFQIKEVVAEFPTNLEIGQYWGDIAIYKDEELIKEDKQVFYILEKAVVTGLEEEKGKEEKVQGFPYLYVGIVIIAILILGGTVWFFWKEKRATKLGSPPRRKSSLLRKNSLPH